MAVLAGTGEGVDMDEGDCITLELEDWETRQH